MDKNVTYEQLTRLAASVVRRVEVRRQEKEGIGGEKHAKRRTAATAG